MAQAATARATSRRRKTAQRSRSARSTYSSGLWHLDEARGAGGLAAQALERGPARPAERRIAHQLLPRDRRARVSSAHLRQELGLGELLHLGEQRRPILPRQGAELELEAALVRHDIERGAGADDAGGDRAMGRIEALLKRAPRAELEVAPPQADDDLRGDLERVDALMIERGMAGESGHHAGIAGLALVGVGRPHGGGLADHRAHGSHRQ
jgi:hypothetical protein